MYGKARPYNKGGAWAARRNGDVSMDISKDKNGVIPPQTCARVLIQALPYIKKYAGKTIVIKYGGNAMINDSIKRKVIADVVLLRQVGINVVLVHGGGPEISDMLKKVGKESAFIGGLRVTDSETIDIVQMVLAGKVSKDLVSLLSLYDTKAIGLCGLDCGFMKARRLLNPPGLGFVGELRDIDPGPIADLLAAGYMPVISSIARDDDGSALNINADTAAARIAAALKAERLLLLTDVPGVLRDQSDPQSLISTIRLSEVPALKKNGVLTGGMIPKIDCCVEAIRNGVGSASMLDGRVDHSILIELFSDGGSGTMIF